MLDAERQWTEPWGGSEDGCACEKCGRRGVAEHWCWSCLLTSATPDCPACAGCVRFADTCPVCRGSGVVDGKPRRGISVYPRLEGLYRYMLAHGAKLEDRLVVELEGQRAPDVDFDADAGALLMLPTSVGACMRPDRKQINEVRERAQRVDEELRA